TRSKEAAIMAFAPGSRVGGGRFAPSNVGSFRLWGEQPACLVGGHSRTGVRPALMKRRASPDVAGVVADEAAAEPVARGVRRDSRRLLLRVRRTAVQRERGLGDVLGAR